MQTISANELKTAGIGAIACALDHEPEVGLSVRGQLRYVVMPADAYQRLRDCELEIALQETRAMWRPGTSTPTRWTITCAVWMGCELVSGVHRAL